jgi:hypothetical protein
VARNIKLPISIPNCCALYSLAAHCLHGIVDKMPAVEERNRMEI